VDVQSPTRDQNQDQDQFLESDQTLTA
jgi:hypothetical protein